MVNQEILEGLKIAVTRGESLRQAMLSFLNAGYTKLEIEDAARELLSQKNKLSQQVTKQPQQSIGSNTSTMQTQQKSSITPTSTPVQNQSQNQINNQSKQIVSNYASSSDSNTIKKSTLGSKVLLIFLIVLLVLLIGSLISIFVFKNEVIQFLSNLGY